MCGLSPAVTTEVFVSHMLVTDISKYQLILSLLILMIVRLAATFVSVNTFVIYKKRHIFTLIRDLLFLITFLIIILNN